MADTICASQGPRNQRLGEVLLGSSTSQHAYQLARLTKVPLQGGDVRENVRTWFSIPPKPIYTST